jgi:hypothetical protein
MDTAIYDYPGESDRPIDPAAVSDGASGWAELLIREDPNANLRELARRAAAGLGLSALYGLALGARQGGPALVQHALGVPLALLVVGLIGAPSMFVFLSISRAEIDGRALASAVARGVGSAGILLAGLAPAAALFVVSSETPQAASSAVLFGLVLGGAVALGRTVWDILRSAWRGRPLSAAATACVISGFVLFSILLAVRIWSAVLPVLGGAS